MAKTTVEFNAEASAALESVSEKLNTTKAEVLRSALSLYMYVVNNLANSKMLGIINEEGGQNKIEKVIVVPGVTSFASASAAAAAAANQAKEQADLATAANQHAATK